jgi:hypothetical protein
MIASTFHREDGTHFEVDRVSIRIAAEKAVEQVLLEDWLEQQKDLIFDWSRVEATPEVSIYDIVAPTEVFSRLPEPLLHCVHYPIIEFIS